VELNLRFHYILRVIFRSDMGRVRNDPQKHEGLYAPCTPIAVFNQAFESVLDVLGKYFCYCYKCRHPSLQLRGSSKWKTAPRNVGRCAAAISLVIIARLRQHNVAPDRY
jgi:hypothetical protein